MDNGWGTCSAPPLANRPCVSLLTCRYIYLGGGMGERSKRGAHADDMTNAARFLVGPHRYPPGIITRHPVERMKRRSFPTQKRAACAGGFIRRCFRSLDAIHHRCSHRCSPSHGPLGLAPCTCNMHRYRYMHLHRCIARALGKIPLAWQKRFGEDLQSLMETLSPGSTREMSHLQRT